MKFGIGQSVRRIEDQRLLTGTGRYTDDITLPRQTHAYFLRSPHAHAKLVRIDTEAARGAPGVIGIVTGADLQKAGIGPIPCVVPLRNRDGSEMQIPKRPAIAIERVRFVGDIVALVVAESHAHAKDAAELIEVEYEELPAVTGTAAALEPSAAQVWDFAKNNIVFDWTLGAEAPMRAAFAKADKVVSVDLVNNRVAPTSLEPRVAAASWSPGDDRYTLYAASQGGHTLRKVLCNYVLKIPEHRLRVVTGDVGGGFGMKIFVYPEYAAILYAARAFGRPVRWASERTEAFLSDTHGRDHVTNARLALDKDGRFLGIHVSTVANLGAYLSHYGPFIPTLAGSNMLTGVYAIPSDKMPFSTPLGATFDCGDFARNLGDALRTADAAGFAARRAASEKTGKLRGLGMAYYIEICGGGSDETAQIRFETGGGVTVLIGSQTNGQGHETAYAQLVSHRLGVPIETIRVVQGDTDQMAYGTGTGGSRAVAVGGSAVMAASERIINKGKTLAAHFLEAAEADIEFADGTFTIGGTDRRISITDVARLSHTPGKLPKGMSAGLDESANFNPPEFTYPNGCHVAEVEVDPATGVTEVVRYAVVDDFGTVINPLLLEGQVHGGTAQGIGQALYEHALYDSDSGQLITGSLMDYCLPRADNLPALAFHYNEIPTRSNPLGVKGAGEAGAIGAPPAVINALVDALARYGVRHVDMPATPEKVWRLINQSAGRQAAE
ncbi:MAG TPA: xanthine dehydrogenase family protein molybdopterin-binding subunit [Alphaproteobacteria bacterium]|nr:xanthine dehydrogenase family protein molybdopterin-binding subunit [Alphaproteobacteria bacterium]